MANMLLFEKICDGLMLKLFYYTICFPLVPEAK